MLTQYKIKNKDIYQFVYDLIDSNMYIIIGDGSAVIIDAIISEEAVELLQSKGIVKLWILITHEHYDHIQGINYLRTIFDCCVMGSKYAIEAIQNPKKNLAAYIESLTVFQTLDESWREQYNIPKDYSCTGDMSFKDNDNFLWEDVKFDIAWTPGHSKGSICISIEDNYYFTGDSLVNGVDVILRLPGGSLRDYNSITKSYLNAIQDDALIFPGHGEIDNIKNFHIV